MSFRKITQIIREWWEVKRCPEIGKIERALTFPFFHFSLFLYTLNIFFSCYLKPSESFLKTLTHTMLVSVGQMSWSNIQYLFFLHFNQHRPIFLGKTHIWQMYISPKKGSLVILSNNNWVKLQEIQCFLLFFLIFHFLLCFTSNSV